MNYAPGSSVMPFEGTSRITGIASTNAHTADYSQHSTSSSFFDQFFLIVDELGRSSPPSSILVFIQLFISFYQFYVSSYLSYLPNNWDFSRFPDKIVRYFNYPIDFGLGDRKIFEAGICSYLILIISALIMIYLIFVLIYYNTNKIFPRYNAHITRFVVSYIIPIFLPALCYNIGFSFNSIFYLNEDAKSTNAISTAQANNFDYQKKDNLPYYIFATVIGILSYIFLSTVFYIDIMFRSSTPYLENTPLSMWDGFPLFLCIFSTTLEILFSRFIDRLPNWSHYLFISCCILYNLYILYCMFLFPMIKRWVNIMMSIIVCSSIFALLFQLFPLRALYRILIPFCILFLSIPVFTIIFRVFRKKIVLKEIEEVNADKESDILRYLRLTISGKCSEFATFKWVKPMGKKATTALLCQISQMISFFPSEHHNLAFHINILSKNNELKLHQRFLLFQLHRVHVLRQSSRSKELNEDLANITRVTSQSISSFSQFLIRTIDNRQELTIDRLRSLSRISRSTNSLCHEMMSRYPNSSRLLLTFSKYVIECQADFKGGVMLFQEGQQIERGKRALIDYAFRSMVNLFPTYLINRIFDSKGTCIINRKKSKSGSSMSADSISNERNNQFSDTDFESNEKIASNVLENPRLRFALKKAVGNMKSTGILILSSSSIFRIILSFIICIMVIIFASSFLDERKINYQNIAQIGKVRKNVDLSLFRMAKLWSYDLGLSPKDSDIKAALGSDVSLNDFHNFSVNPSVALFSDIVESILSVEKLGKLLIEVKYDDSMQISDKSTTDFFRVSNISFCNRETREVIKSTTTISYFTLYLLNQALRSSILYMKYEYPNEWKDDECVCEIILNMQNVVNTLSDQSRFLVSQEEELSKANRKEIIILFCVCIPIAFVIYIIPFIVGYLKIYLEFTKIFDVLSLLPINVYKDSCKPIAKFQTEFEQNIETTYQDEQRGCQKIVVFISTFLSSIIIAGGLIGICFVILDVNNQFYAIVKWLEIGSVRAPLLLETITNAIYAGIYGYLGDTDYTTLTYHLENLFEISQKLLYQHKTLVWGSNDSTSCNKFSSRLDSLHFTNTCMIDIQGNSLQTNYKCMSLDQQIMTFNKLAKDEYLTLLYAYQSRSDDSQYDFNEAFVNKLNGYEAINLHYLGITFMLPKLEAAQTILDEAINLKIDKLSQYTLIIALCTLVAEFILFLIDMILINYLNDEYNIVRILIARLPPAAIVEAQSLIELIIGKSDYEHLKKYSPIMIHIRFCPDAIVAFDKKCKIQLTNLAASKTFGFSKEQLFHQHISTIIRKDDSSFIQDKCNRNNEGKKKRKKVNKSDDEDEISSINPQVENESINKVSLLLNTGCSI